MIDSIFEREPLSLEKHDASLVDFFCFWYQVELYS